MDGAHPIGVTGSEVIVDGDDVDPIPRKGVEVGRHGGDQRLALTGLHLRHHPPVQGHSPDHLNVEMALAQHSFGRFPNRGKGLDHEVIKGLALCEATAELDRAGRQTRRRKGIRGRSLGR